MPLRLGRVLLAAFVALSLLVLLNGTLAVSATASPATSPARPPAHLPALTAADTFSATAVLTVSADSVTMGDAFTVTAGLVTTGTCRFALYDVTLRQSDPLFAYVDPPGSVIGPPGENPAIWRLGAAKTGVTTFTVEFYGETNCDGVWQWTTVRSGSQPVPVTPAPTRIVLPFVGRNTPPVPVTALGSLGGGYSIAIAINDRGQVAGNSRIASGQEHAFLWQNGVMTDLDTLGGLMSAASALNERGQVAGHSTFRPSLPEHAFLWASGVMTDIGGAVESNATHAVDINRSGQVLVYAPVAGSLTTRGFVWSDGAISFLGAPGNWSTPMDINDRGQAVGYLGVDGTTHAFVWQNGVITGINPLGADSSGAWGINERGQVTGIYFQPAGVPHGFLWEDGVFTSFDAPSGDLFGIDAFNARGQVAATYRAETEFRTFLWSKEAGPVGLGLIRDFPDTYACPSLLDDSGRVVVYTAAGSVLWRAGDVIPLAPLTGGVSCAQAMNNRGQIVGWSSDAEGELHAVLWEAGE